MTVAELIALLKPYPDHFEVRYDTENGDLPLYETDVYRGNMRPIVYIGKDLDQED